MAPRKGVPQHRQPQFKKARTPMGPVELAHVVQALTEWRKPIISARELDEILQSLAIDRDPYTVIGTLKEQGFLLDPLESSLDSHSYRIPLPMRGATSTIKAMVYLDEMKKLVQT